MDFGDSQKMLVAYLYNGAKYNSDHFNLLALRTFIDEQLQAAGRDGLKLPQLANYGFRIKCIVRYTRTAWSSTCMPDQNQDQLMYGCARAKLSWY